MCPGYTEGDKIPLAAALKAMNGMDCPVAKEVEAITDKPAPINIERKKVGRPFFTYRSTRRNTFFRSLDNRPAGVTWAKFNAAVKRR